MLRPINAAGLQITKDFEKLRLVAYNDNPEDPANGVITIGWGHTGRDVYEGMTCTREQADQWLEDDMVEACIAVTRRVTVPLNDNQYAALVDFDFNTGGVASNTKSGRPHDVLVAVNEGRLSDVPALMARQDGNGVWAGWVFQRGVLRMGLVRRRKAEIVLWETPCTTI